MRNYWEASDLESLHTKLRDTSQAFEHRYRAILNDVQNDIWFEAVSRYEPVEINGKSFRLSVNQHFQVIGQNQLQTAR
jgi:PIN domain nuclease of toxin-antitoxin system